MPPRGNTVNGRGGSSIKKWNFLVLSYVCCSPSLVFPKWAHLSLNSKRLSRWRDKVDPSAPFFVNLYIGKTVKSDLDFNLRRVVPATWWSDLPKNLYTLVPGMFMTLCSRIFDFSIFCLFRVFLAQFLAKWTNVLNVGKLGHFLDNWMKNPNFLRFAPAWGLVLFVGEIPPTNLRFQILWTLKWQNDLKSRN